ncbi:Uncharacterised protein [Mycobacteroides abscessus subsp. abscessus]|nr:Uncharacterised protein [Mycobacteroides abscessus subsp. abscessus]
MMLFIQFFHRPQLLQLGFQLHSITAFSFYCCNSMSKEGIKADSSLLQQLLFRCLPCHSSCCVDSPAAVHDIHIAGTFKAHFKLLFPAAAICCMSVGIDQSRSDKPAGSINNLCILQDGSIFFFDFPC